MKRGDFISRKTIVNGQEVLQAKIQDVSRKIINVDDPTTFIPPAFALPLGEFTLIKQEEKAYIDRS